MAINHLTIQTILDTQLATVVGLPSLTKENVRKKTDGTAWCRSMVSPNITEIASLGIGGYNRLNGLYVVDLMYPQDVGITDVLTMADTVLSYFQAGLILTSGVDRVEILNSYPLSGRSLQIYYQKPIIVEFQGYNTRTV